MTPPRLARALLERFIDPRLRDAVIGDLDEIFAAACHAHPRRARVAYWTQSIGLLIRLRASGARRTAHTDSSTAPGDGVIAMLLNDLRHGARLFVTQPAYALAAMVTLGLAIGANAVIFTMADRLVLKPLPLREPDRLGWIFATGADVLSWRGPISLPEYAAYRDGVAAYQQLSAYQRRALTMRAGDQTERVVAHVVIGDLHGLWGLGAVVGRSLTRDDERGGAAPVAVLSHRFWMSRFGGSADVLGDTIRLDGAPRSVVGVLAPDIELGNFAEIDVWLPSQQDPSQAAWNDQSWRAVGRMADTATIELTHAQVQTVAARLVSAHQDRSRDRSARVGATKDALGTPNTWVVLSMLVTVVGLLLLLACANVMNLLVARLLARRGELALRAALGGTRGRILRQITTEGLVLGVAGGALGLALAFAGVAAVRAIAYEPFFRQLSIDWRVVGFALALTLVAPIVFSILPARRMLRADAAAVLNEAGARSAGSRRTSRAQSALVVVQVALAATLLVVATLVVRSMQALNGVDPGYAVAGLLSTHIEIPKWHVADDEAASRLRSALVQRAGAIIGAAGVATVTELPALQQVNAVAFSTAMSPLDPAAGYPSAGLTVVSPDYFDVVDLPVVHGRGFTRQDEATVAPVVVISQAMARRFWSDEHGALGAQLVIDPSSTTSRVAATVIGVSADLATFGLEEARPQMYLLDAHRPTRSFYLLVRSQSPATLASELRAAVRAVDPELATYHLRTVEEAFADEASSNVLLGAMFAAFALVALLLASAGLYGVMSYVVNHRRPEIAIRMALGASSRSVAWEVMSRSLSLAGVGAALGVVVAFGLAQLMRSTLFGVGPSDPATYLGVVAVIGLAAVAASSIPIRRAVRVDPIQGMRHQS